MANDAQLVSEYADGLRCGKCHQARFRGLCPCEREARFSKNIAELEAWQATITGLPKRQAEMVQRSVDSAISREVTRAGLRSKPALEAHGDDPNAQATIGQVMGIRRRNMQRDDKKRDPFRWTPPRTSVADELPLPA